MGTRNFHSCESKEKGRSVELRPLNFRPESQSSCFRRNQRRGFGFSAGGQRHGFDYKHQQGSDKGHDRGTIEHNIPVPEFQENLGGDPTSEDGGYALRHVKEAIVRRGIVGTVVVADDGREEREHAAPDEIRSEENTSELQSLFGI